MEALNFVGSWIGVRRLLGLEAWRATFRPDLSTIDRVVELKCYTLSDPVFGMKSLSAAIGYTTHGRRNAASAPPFLRTRGPHGGPLFASLRWPHHTGCSLEAIDRPRCVSHQQGAYSRESEG